MFSIVHQVAGFAYKLGIAFVEIAAHSSDLSMVGVNATVKYGNGLG